MMLILVLCRIARLLPHRLALWLGTALGNLWFYLVPIRRSVALENLKLAFEERFDRGERRRIARRAFVNMGRGLIETLRLPGSTREEMERLVATEGQEHLDRAVADGRGVLILTAHFGNWELLCRSQTLRGLPLHIIARRIYSRRVNEAWSRLHRRCRIRRIPARSSVSLVLKALRAGEVVGMVIDQHIPPPQGVPVSFFGRPAQTTDALAVLAERTGAPVLPAFIVHEGAGRHRAIIMAPLDYERVGEDRRRNIIHNTQRYTDILEEMIRRYPDHWIWVHRRWKATSIEPQVEPKPQPKEEVADGDKEGAPGHPGLSQVQG